MILGGILPFFAVIRTLAFVSFRAPSTVRVIMRVLAAHLRTSAGFRHFSLRLAFAVFLFDFLGCWLFVSVFPLCAFLRPRRFCLFCGWALAFLEPGNEVSQPHASR